MRRVVPLIALLAACEPEPPTVALFAIPGASDGDDFYALPFPNDLRREADGTIDLSLFPTNSVIVDKYRAAADQLDGFALNAPVFVRFSDELLPSSLPSPAASIMGEAAVYLQNIDPASAWIGHRTPLVLTFRVAATDTLGDNHLVARPYPGFGLMDGTTYALVVTNRVRDAYGEPVQRSGEFAQLVGTGGSEAVVAARAVYQPLLDFLDEPGGDERDDVVSAAVFTTQHATPIVPAIRDAIYALPAPTALTMIRGPIDLPEMVDYQGTYEAPSFQTGEVPYRETGGEIVVGADGKAVVQRMEPMRFAITLPRTPMPAAGYPLALYQHGTGGDYRSFIEDGTAFRLAQQGIATISTDQVLHATRNPGGDASIDFFNINNPLALRDNILQGTADAFSQHRLALTLAFADAPTVKLDPTKIYFFGHSQGGTTGPGFVAFEPAVSGAVLSGTSGNITLTILDKTMPLDLPGLIGATLRDDPVDIDNPSLALLQLWMERSDGINYAPLMALHPVGAPKNIFMPEGFTDHYTPNRGIQAFATAVGAELAMTPDMQPVEGITLRGGRTLAMPITNNAGVVTNVLAQYEQAPGSDGHFVTFDIELARQHTARFLGTLAATGMATVVSE